MRNVASRHLQEEDDQNQLHIKKIESTKWNSLPMIHLNEKEQYKTNEIEEMNEDEGLQEVAGKLEIRVVPKENIVSPKPQTIELETNEQIEEKPKVKLERTKSILKQSSKEKNENNQEVLSSPKREQITFAIDINDAPIKKRVSLEAEEVRIEPEVKNEEKEEKSEKSASSTETEQKNSDKKIEEIKEKCEIVENPPSRCNSPKAISKPLEKLKNNLGHSGSESSSSTQDKGMRNGLDKKTNGEVKRCSPSVDLTANPAVTFVPSEPK